MVPVCMNVHPVGPALSYSVRGRHEITVFPSVFFAFVASDEEDGFSSLCDQKEGGQLGGVNLPGYVS